MGKTGLREIRARFEVSRSTAYQWGKKFRREGYHLPEMKRTIELKEAAA